MTISQGETIAPNFGVLIQPTDEVTVYDSCSAGIGFRHLGQGIALDLCDVEHMRALREDPTRTLAGLVFAALGLVQDLVEHDRRSLLALADLCAERLPLAIGCPETVPEVLRLGAGPEGKNIDPAIGLAGDRIDGAGQRGAAAVPGERVVAGAALQCGNDLVGDGVVDAGGWALRTWSVSSSIVLHASHCAMTGAWPRHRHRRSARRSGRSRLLPALLSDPRQKPG